MSQDRGSTTVGDPDAESTSVRYRFSVLMGSLTLLLLASGVMPQLLLSQHSLLVDLLVTGAMLLLFAGVLISAAVAVSPQRRTRQVAIVLALPVIVLHALAYWLEIHILMELMCLAAAAFLAFTIVMILRHVFEAKTVHGEVIYAALCAYLMMGILWAFLYALIELVQPESFSHPHEPNMHPKLGIAAEDFGMVLYYSFITLSTVGYGDITPVTPVARTLAASEAIAGQLYLAVLVARLVGLHTAFRLAQIEREERKRMQ